VADTSSANLQDSPTVSLAATQAGVILGTAAYMSPEQARGKQVDKRSDIWAFGVVLYELLTGRQPFEGEDVTETLAAVVKQQPDFGAIPYRVRRVLRSCLEKDPRNRLQAIRDWSLLLDETEAATKKSTSLVTIVGWALAGVMAIGLVMALWSARTTSPPSANAMRFDVPRKEIRGRPLSEFAVSRMADTSRTSPLKQPPRGCGCNRSILANRVR